MPKDAVRKARMERGVTGVAMATQLGMGVATYYKKEAGQLKWSLEDAKAVADFMDTTIDALFFADEIAKTDN